jgi:hypothetical protein
MVIANNMSVIFLTIVWFADGKFVLKWKRLKSSTWSWPFIIYYALLVIGLAYTKDFENGLFTLDKKISFLALPVIMSTGKTLHKEFEEFLKRSFIYSCCIVIVLCFPIGAYYSLHNGPIANFDISTSENYKAIHPDASPVWMYFSYIQLTHWAGFHPAYLSAYLVFCLALIFTLSYSSKAQRNIHISLGVLIACVISLLSSRMAILAFIGSSIYLMVMKAEERKIKKIFPIVSMSIVLILVLWLNPVARFRVIEEPIITNYKTDRTVTNWNSVNYRLLEWGGSWSVISANWFNGVGTGGWKLALNNFYANYNSSTVGLELNAHNQYLQTWMENGVLGVLAFLGCVCVGLPRLRNDSSYVSFILIFSLMCLTESFGERQKGVVFFTLFQALFLGFERQKA